MRCEWVSLCHVQGEITVVTAFRVILLPPKLCHNRRPAEHIVQLPLPCEITFGGKFDLTSAHAFVVASFCPRTPAGAAEGKQERQPPAHRRRRRHVSDTSRARVFPAAADVLTADCPATTPSCGVKCVQDVNERRVGRSHRRRLNRATRSGHAGKTLLSPSLA